MEDNNNTKVVVVGAGLVGSLEACVMAKRGYDVHLYEFRPDIRKMEHVPGKSINLAISLRGLTGLSEVGLSEHITREYAIPMYGRLIHKLDCSTYVVPYGKKDQCIYSIGRRYLNEILLNAGEKYPNLHIHFEHKLVDIDVNAPKMQFLHKGETVEVDSEFVLGCDGAFSTVRKAMIRNTTMNFSQTYIPHPYLELLMPPTKDGDFAMKPNYLHIWPRGQFMLIGLPNQDKSFTMTLFMPREKFASINTPSDLVTFFEKYYPDALPLLGESKLIKDYFGIKPSNLVSVKCFPYNVSDTTLLLGDAAHAMVPFYGQGLNCGLEDVVILDEFLAKYPFDRKRAFDEYSEFRSPDAEAICELAMYNYVEMRDSVTKTGFWFRKMLDNALHSIMPSIWVPLYASVTFSRMRYHKCIENRAWQDKILGNVTKLLVYGALGVMAISSAVLMKKNEFVFMLPTLKQIQSIFNPL